MKPTDRSLAAAALAALLGLWTPSAAGGLAAAPAGERPPLPAGLAPGERPVRPEDARGQTPPPTGEVHTPAEYDRNLGILIRWGVFNDILTDMTVAITTLDPDARVWIVVSGASQQSSATSTLLDAGADLSQVSFLTAPTDTVWIRDYGPRFILENKELAVVDHTYNRPRPQDDLIPGAVAAAWSLPLYDTGLIHGGGNFHLFSDGEAFMSDLVLDENPGLTPEQVQDRFLDFQNLDVTIFEGFPTSFDSTQHIDMWLFPARDRVVLINQYAAATGQPHTITENAVTTLQSRGYTVLRLPGWNSVGTHYTYANAVALNEVVLVPQYSSYPPSNAAALTTFQQAFPGRTIVGIDADAIVGSAGVLHCIVMHVPDPDWIFSDDFETGDLTLWTLVLP